MSKVYVDSNGNETEFFDIVKVEKRTFGEEFVVDDKNNVYKVKDCFVNMDIAEVNTTCVIVVEEGYVFINNKLSTEKRIEQFVEQGIFTKVQEDDSK